MKIFASGSCRLLTTINNGYEKVIPIHSMFYNFVGINFLGKLHNTKQHIQFIKYIKDEITLLNNILPNFLTSYNDVVYTHKCEDLSLIPIKKESIKKQFDECEWYLFEICSLKLYKNNNYEVQYELTNEYECILQTEDELLEDLYTIRKLIPNNKKILFQVHFRPNIIYNDNTKSIEKREIIYNIVNNFCSVNDNTFIYDPSIIINKNNELFDGDTHFTPNGHIESFNYINNNYFIT
jgi:hypothetical protein